MGSKVTANPMRNEYALELGEESLLLRGSFAGIKAIETRAGRSILMLSIDGANPKKGLGLAEVVDIVTGGLIGAGAEKVDQDELAEKILAVGYAKVYGQAVKFLAACVTSHQVSIETKAQKKR